LVTDELKLVPVVSRVESANVTNATANLHLPGGASVEFNAAQVSAAWVAEAAIEAIDAANMVKDVQARCHLHPRLRGK